MVLNERFKVPPKSVEVNLNQQMAQTLLPAKLREGGGGVGRGEKKKKSEGQSGKYSTGICF